MYNCIVIMGFGVLVLLLSYPHSKATSSMQYAHRKIVMLILPPLNKTNKPNTSLRCCLYSLSTFLLVSLWLVACGFPRSKTHSSGTIERYKTYLIITGSLRDMTLIVKKSSKFACLSVHTLSNYCDLFVDPFPWM